MSKSDEESETSSVDDARNILENLVPPDIVTDYQYRRTMQLNSYLHRENNTYYSCIKTLQHGFIATKYNFTDHRHRKVALKLTKDCSKLMYYTPENLGATMWQ